MVEVGITMPFPIRAKNKCTMSVMCYPLWPIIQYSCHFCLLDRKVTLLTHLSCTLSFVIFHLSFVMLVLHKPKSLKLAEALVMDWTLPSLICED